MIGAIAAGSWVIASGAYAIRRRQPWIGDALAIAGSLSGVALLTMLWFSLGRPPIRTLAETRWWYAVLVPTLSLLIGWRFKTRAMVIPGCLMGAAFAAMNLMHPEYQDKTLMPALQSPWFVPHVVVYMLAYAALGLSSLIAVWVLLRSWIKKCELQPSDVVESHRLIQVGLPLLTLGLLFGALWAKDAWGHYWTWDPKETWACITWLAYLVYLHAHTRHAMSPKLNLWLLVVGFAALLGCWFGVNMLPTAQESVHTYTRQ